MTLTNFLLISLCWHLVFCRDTYKAGILDVSSANSKINNYAALIKDASELNLDIFVFPTHQFSTQSASETCGRCTDNFDEIVKTVSSAAKESKIYVVTNAYEKIKCEHNEDLVRSTLVFNRNGDIISIYRKPFNRANCNSTYSNSASFSTDFGVEFGVLMEEDIFQNFKDTSLRHFIVLGSLPYRMELFSASHFVSSWAFIAKSNVISAYGVYGDTEKITKSGNIIMGNLNKIGNENPQLISSPLKHTFSSQNLNQHSIKVLDLNLSARGYEEIVCQEKFCCQFYVKTENNEGQKQSEKYGLIAHSGLRNFGPNNVATQRCIIAYMPIYQETILSENTTNVKFEKLAISSNFSEDSAQYPILLTSTQTTMKNFKFQKQNELKLTQINTEIHNSDNVLTFGILCRDFTIDAIIDYNNSTDSKIDISDYISSENLQECFDYIWLRLRVVIFIVSIYILEMM